MCAVRVSGDMAWTHRPALDGVRSVAVYLVLLFHAGIAAFDGGFIGVDLFFVLSGFLVSSILLDELDETGRVRLWRFYARRVRRLLPAALVVVVATSAVFVLLASSVRRLPLVGDAQASLMYVANWRFLAQENDYFGADINRSPFLHFWSLSIEEQFYVFFPLLLLALFALARRWRLVLPVGVGVVFASSVAAQVVWAASDGNHAYYGTDARAYQLMAGVLAALALRAISRQDADPNWARRVSPIAAPSGLVVLLVVASGMVDLSPSARGLFATVASVALILGLAVAEGRALARLLGRPLFAYLGRISYGTYLWHWPVLIVLREVFNTSPWVLAALTTGMATALASLSFEVLEHPIRRARMLARWAPQTVAVGLTASVVAAVGVAPAILNSEARPVLATQPGSGGPRAGRPVPQDIDWREFADDKGPDDTFCTADDLESCVVETGDSGLSVALIGDSNARMLAPALQQLAAEHDFTLSLQVSTACPWQHQVYRLGPLSDDGEACVASREDLYDTVLRDLDVDVVLLLQLSRDRGKYLDASRLSQEDFDSFNYDAQSVTLDEIAKAGADSVIMEPILQVPADLPEPLDCLASTTTTTACRVPVPLAHPPSEAFARSFAAKRPDVASVTMNDLMCPDAPLCEPLIGQAPTWRDREHYAPAAVDQVRESLWSRLEATGLFDS